jgi:hypothetical protein
MMLKQSMLSYWLVILLSCAFIPNPGYAQAEPVSPSISEDVSATPEDVVFMKSTLNFNCHFNWTTLALTVNCTDGTTRSLPTTTLLT